MFGEAALPSTPTPAAVGAPACRLQLWHRSNWHWYCKAERRYCMCDGVVLQWDDAAPRLLHVLTAEGDYQQVGAGGLTCRLLRAWLGACFCRPCGAGQLLLCFCL